MESVLDVLFMFVKLHTAKHLAQAYDQLAGFISLLGGVCSMCCSVILPCLCYSAMQCAGERKGTQSLVGIMLMLGCAILFVVVIANINRVAT